VQSLLGPETEHSAKCFRFLTPSAVVASVRVERSLPFAFGLLIAFPHTSPMSQTRPNSESRALSNSNYQDIFSVALESYKRRTGNDLTSNPLLPRLETCNSPDAVIAVLREQIPGFDQSRSDNDSERLSNWLNPTVSVIAAFSGTIGESVGPVGLRVFHLPYPNLDADAYFLGIPTRGIDLYGHSSSSLSEF
jgi:hypothetical protein